MHLGDLSGYNRSKLNISTTSLAVDIAKPSENKLPIIFRWRFRLSDDKPDTFSFIVGHFLVLDFDKDGSDYNDLVSLIDISYREYLNLLLLTAEKESLPEEMKAFKYDEQIKKNKANEILEIARQQLLL